LNDHSKYDSDLRFSLPACRLFAAANIVPATGPTAGGNR
jgi:hypothetical protein